MENGLIVFVMEQTSSLEHFATVSVANNKQTNRADNKKRILISGLDYNFKKEKV
tara:strand:+ start:440 stop:601 length:162 start_codon:yes stop_codon:yes gene_type:complete